MARTYPALDVIWTMGPDAERLDRLLAEVDDDGPTAVDEQTDRVRIYFATPALRSRAAARIVALEPDLMCEPIDVPDEQWAERSQAALGAVQVGRLIVAPPWIPRPPGPVDSRTSGPTWITIVPSMGFGTAHHASTRLCLRLLQDSPVQGAAVLDVGTGSGVLAIAAARLGASCVLGVDHDPDALTSARENVDLNQVSRVVTIQPMDLGTVPATPDRTFDLVLANLTGATLSRFASRLAAFIRPGGALIASGVGTEEGADVTAALACAGLMSRELLEEDHWLAVRCVRSEQHA